MEPSSIVLILAPILFPVATALGIDPVHFGILMVVNMEVGMCHPPVGLNLYVASGITKMGITELTVAVWPWLLTMLCFLMVVTYWPACRCGCRSNWACCNAVCARQEKPGPGRGFFVRSACGTIFSPSCHTKTMKFALSIIALILVALVVPFLIPGLAKQEGLNPEADLPWQIEVDGQGGSRVFGLQPGVSTLAQVKQKLGNEVEVAIIAGPNEAGRWRPITPRCRSASCSPVSSSRSMPGRRPSWPCVSGR
jgi:hypothetical protein